MYICLSLCKCNCVLEDYVNTCTWPFCEHDDSWPTVSMSLCPCPSTRVYVQDLPVNRCTILHMHMCGFLTLLVNLWGCVTWWMNGHVNTTLQVNIYEHMLQALYMDMCAQTSLWMCMCMCMTLLWVPLFTALLWIYVCKCMHAYHCPVDTCDSCVNLCKCTMYHTEWFLWPGVCSHVHSFIRSHSLRG